jgi:hypothetical protein
MDAVTGRRPRDRIDGRSIRVSAAIEYPLPMIHERPSRRISSAVLVTADQIIIHQQTMRARAVGLIVLSTNHWPTLRENADRILQIIDGLEPAGYAYVAAAIALRSCRVCAEC